MSECNLALNATINQKQQPNNITVHGSVMVYTEKTQVTLSKAEPQGIIPSTLLLKLEITDVPGPMKGMPRAFHYEESGNHVQKFTQVQVLSNKGHDCTVDVEILG